MKAVAQQDSHGCGVACLAMVLRTSYEHALEEVAEVFGSQPDFSAHGLIKSHIEQVLARHDLVWRTLYSNSTEPWPPEPFAPSHIASVRQPSGHSHFVVLLDDGLVLDPLYQHNAHNALGDWPEIRNVMGIWRL